MVAQTLDFDTPLNSHPFSMTHDASGYKLELNGQTSQSHSFDGAALELLILCGLRQRPERPNRVDFPLKSRSYSYHASTGTRRG